MKYRLRWRYHYKNGTTKYGMWSRAAEEDDHHNLAWANHKDTLKVAAIEGKDIRTSEIKTLVDCQGHDFVNFQMMAIAMCPSIFPKGVTALRPITQMIGLSMTTRNKLVEVFDTGEITMRDRTEKEKNGNLRIFGK